MSPSLKTVSLDVRCMEKPASSSGVTKYQPTERVGMKCETEKPDNDDKFVMERTQVIKSGFNLFIDTGVQAVNMWDT